jgi:hypothetical protein
MRILSFPLVSWHDVMIETWLIPFGEWHLRLHRINSARTLQTVEGDLR